MSESQHTQRILYLDDDVNLLAGIKRQHRKQFDIEAVLDPDTALGILQSKGPFAVVVSDLRMPGMDGNTFLAKVRHLYPDTVRILLTGQGDLDAATTAINEGRVFRFLTKPCPAETLAEVFRAALRQYELITAEKVLLQETLHGSMHVLTDILSLVSPLAFGRASRIKKYVSQVCEKMEIEEVWPIEMAATLSQIGCVTLPSEVLEKSYTGQELEDHQTVLFHAHCQIGRELLRNIPRLEGVAEIVAYQEKYYDGSGFPEDSVKGADIPLGARILKTVLDIDRMESSGTALSAAIGQIRKKRAKYDPLVLNALSGLERVERAEVTLSVRVDELIPGMMVAEDIVTYNQMLLVSRGQAVTDALIQRLANYSGGGGIKEPILVKSKTVAR